MSSPGAHPDIIGNSDAIAAPKLRNAMKEHAQDALDSLRLVILDQDARLDFASMTGEEGN